MCARAPRTRPGARARRVRHLLPERRLRLVRQPGHHRRLEEAGRDRHDPDSSFGEVAGDRQGHADDAALRRRVRRLADLPVERGDGRGVDDDAALASPARRAGSRDRLVAAIAAAASRITLNVPMRLTPDRALERSSGSGAVAADRAARRSDAGAVHGDAQRRPLPAPLDGGLHRGLVRDVGRRERAPGRRVARGLLAARAGQVDERRPDAPPAASRAAVARPRPEAPPVTSADAPSSSMCVLSSAGESDAFDDRWRWPCRRPRTWSAGRSGRRWPRAWLSERREQPRAGGAERVAERDGAAARVELRGIGAGLGEPGQRHRRERLVDLVRVDVVDASRPARSSTFSVAGMTPVSMSSGSSPTTENDRNRARGVEPELRRRAPRS